MADENDKISFLLDLDIKEFAESGLKAKGIIEKLGSSESMVGLTEGLMTVGVGLAAAGIAAYAFKSAIDLTVEGEEIQRVNNQFELLTKNAGVATDKLKKGLEEAAKGLVDDDELLKIANASIVKMGQSAEKLPQIMELARKATQVYGGEAKANFEAISEALANGNTRALKHYGIIVDSEKALKQFAAANNTTVEALSEVGKRQAILNAALDKGKEAFKGVEENSESATNTLKTLSVTFSQIGQIFVEAIEKKIGPSMRWILKQTQSLSTGFKDLAQSMIGSNDEASKKMIENSQKVTQESIIDIEKQKKQREAYTKALDSLSKSTVDLQKKNINDLATLEDLAKQRGLESERRYQANVQQIKNSAQFTEQQKKNLLAMEDKRFKQEQLQDERELDSERTKLLDNYVKNSETAFGGISRAFVANSQKMKLEQADMGKRGNEMWNSLSTNATAAFTNMGAQMAQGKDIASATADAMKGFFLGMLGDRAMAEGSMLLLSSIWPPNPLGLAAGAGLLALGGALKSAAGAGSAGSTMPSSPSVAATASGAAPKIVETTPKDTDMASPEMPQQQRAQRTVQVNIAGNYLETDQTKRMLMDLMRQETDATGFAYNQIGA